MSDEKNRRRDERLRELGVDRVVDERDVEYMLGTSGDVQEAVVCTLATYRQPDSLEEGDTVPDVELHGLRSGSLRLPALVRNRPLVLFFGSYT